MNVGLFGGTFDPPHNGHLLLAEYAREEFALDLVYFIPAFRSPFKALNESSPPEIRAEMVQLAINDNSAFRLETCELTRQTVSYTVDTVRFLAERHPNDELHLLIGADAFQDFHLWKDPQDIANMAQVCVANRVGCEVSVRHLPFPCKARRFAMPVIEISSRDIRHRVRNGKSIRYIVPWTVKTFIEYQGLYRDRKSSA